MWDFDDVEYPHLINDLTAVQLMHQLPTIWIIRSSKTDKFHAYCFCRATFSEAAQVIASSELVDRQFLGLGIMRGYWTLRITKKQFLDGTKSVFQYAGKITSPNEPDVKAEDCKAEVTYWTRLD